MTATPEGATVGNGSTAPGPPDAAKKVPLKAGKTLPTTRISLSKQFELLRAYGALYATTGRAVRPGDVAPLVKMHPETARLANAFFADVGLLQKTDAGMIPHPDVVSFHRAHEFGAEDAPYRLQSVLKESWFAKALMPRLTFRSIEESEAISLLADAANATPDHRSQLQTVLGFLETAGMLTKEGTVLRAGKVAEPAGSVELIGVEARSAIGNLLPKVDESPQTQMRTVDLPRVQGRLTLTGNFNFMALKGDEMKLVLDLIGLIDKFEEKITAPKAEAHGDLRP